MDKKILIFCSNIVFILTYEPYPKMGQYSPILMQSCFIVADELWETDFDPVHVLLRAVYKKDFQSAMDRYTDL